MHSTPTRFLARFQFLRGANLAKDVLHAGCEDGQRGARPGTGVLAETEKDPKSSSGDQQASARDHKSMGYGDRERLFFQITHSMRAHWKQDVLKATNSFHCKKMCDSRVYEYLAPTYVFRKVCGDELRKRAIDRRADQRPEMVINETYLQEELTSDSIRSSHDFRMDAKDLERIRSAIKLFIGTNSYHSYTPKMQIGDESARRHILSFDVGTSVVCAGSGVLKSTKVRRSDTQRWHRVGIVSDPWPIVYAPAD